MLGYLLVLFLLLPFLDLYILIEISGMIGFLETVGLVLFTGVVGAAVVRREGRGLLSRLQTSVTAREVSRNLLEGVFLLLGGLMLLSPGLITDALGLVFVVRPTRERLMLYAEEKLRSNANVEFRTYQF